MLPRKKFENLHAVMAILVLSEQLSGKFCLNILSLILSVCFAKCDALCSHIFDCYQRGSKLWKNCSHQKHF